jgi:radical SAM superfamily enzyme YgiQ (UPF0313 family)
MHILLISTHYPVSETPSPLLGPAYLAAALEQAAIDVTVLKELPAVDTVVQGEGESTLAELASAVAGDRPLAEVTGTVFRNGSDLRITAWRPPEDMQQLPLTVTTSRGCPHLCTFCAGRTMGGSAVRYRNPAPVVDDLEVLPLMGFHQIDLAERIAARTPPPGTNCRAP